MATLPKEEELTPEKDPTGPALVELINQECKKGEDEAPVPDLEDMDQDEDADVDISAKGTDDDDPVEEASPVTEGMDEDSELLEEDSEEEAQNG